MANQFKRRISPYLDIFRTAWQNRDQMRYAWRILRDGVCDGCALGTTGMHDWTMSGIHLCWIRLNLLRLNTVAAFDPDILRNVESLGSRSERDLRKLGRLPAPLIRRRGDTGFQTITWDDAITLIADRLRVTDPRRLGFYIVSRGTANETYYVAQKVARFLGTNHIDNSARVCHAPSTTALKQTIGCAATTCSYKDLIGSDLVVFIGSDVANNQPVVMKYLLLAKNQGTKVVLINPFREPGMEKYWVPSSVQSALFGTKMTDAFFQIKVGGDIAFINGVLKHLIAHRWTDEDFIRNHTTLWDALVKELDGQSFEELEQHSGATREQMLEFARLYAQAKSAIFVWSMGITMHRYGVANVKSIVNLALARGMVGRPKTGLMAIRGHSGVQGGAEMGAVPNQFPGGVPFNKDGAQNLQQHWNFEVPHRRGYYVAEMIEAAHRGEMEVFYCVGSNLFGILPDSRYVRQAIEKIPLRIHHDIVLNPQMLVEAADTVLLLPATTRYEMKDGNTETSTERRVIFNPEIPGPRIPGARDEWRVLVEIAKRVKPDLSNQIDLASTQQIREEIARVVPSYDGIQNLRNKGDQFQWGGPMLAEGGWFNTADGKARFAPVAPPQRDIPQGWFQLNTRRGKQFNSITFSDNDPLISDRRDVVVMASEDLQRLGIEHGQTILLRSETGEFRGRAQAGPIQPGTVMMYWPEANALIRRGVTDPDCGIPAYRDEIVEVVT
jgi:molybdopterin-dependent oxidoreductase alpha subunit